MIRLAINGYGRIGRCVLRALYDLNFRDQMQIVAINEPDADGRAMAYLTRYDSTHGRFAWDVDASGDSLIVGSDTILISHQSNVRHLPWNEVDLVLECSGRYSQLCELEWHLACGASKVLLSHPGEPAIPAIVWGVNHGQLSGDDTIISAASCTSNAVVPVIDVLDQAFGVESGFVTVIHSAMNDQPVLDSYHHADRHKMRAAWQSIVPVDTRLAAGIARVLPRFEGRFTARSLRVPVANVSAIELAVNVSQSTTVAAINRVLQDASKHHLVDILGCTEEALVSADVNRDTRSALVDLCQTQVIGKQASVWIWFDNEWAYANRMLDVVRYWSCR